MISEKPNNKNGWINKLDDLGHLPEDVFNKETSWNKLHERLHAKLTNRKMLWYWLVAACVFFACFISLLIPRKKESVLVKNILQAKKNDSAIVQKQPMLKMDTTSGVSYLPVKNKMPAHIIRKMDITTVGNHPNINDNDIVKNTNEGITAKLNNGKSALMSVDTLIDVVVNVPEKKKLKVVHINELGDPVSETPSIATYNEQHAFQFKFMNQQVYTKSSPTATKTGFKIFTIKNFTTN